MKKLVLFLVVLGVLAGAGYEQEENYEKVIRLADLISYYNPIIDSTNFKWVNVKANKEFGWEKIYQFTDSFIYLSLYKGVAENGADKMAFNAHFKFGDAWCHCYFEGRELKLEENHGSYVFLWLYGKGVFEKVLKPAGAQR